MKSLIFLVLVVFSNNLWAVGKALDFSIHQEYTSTRALGMGNAFAAVADDHSALFYNPAALALRKDGQVRMFVRGGIDADYLKLVDDIDKAGKQPTEDDKIDAYAELIEANYGNHYYSRLPTIGAVWVRPNWGIAIIPADLSLDIGIHQKISASLDVNAYLDTTIAYGYARTFEWLGSKHPISIGTTVKAIHRVYYGQELLAAQLAVDSDIFKTSDSDEGMTFDMDIGALYTPKTKSRWFRPTAAVVLRNALDYGFTTNLHLIDKESGQPPDLERRIDIGTKFELPDFWVFDPHFALDMRDMLHPNWTFKKGFHAGAELYWKMYNWWKGHWSVGLNQGYYTLGFGARFAWFQIDLATWGEEVGTEDVPIESRRYIVEMSLDF